MHTLYTTIGEKIKHNFTFDANAFTKIFLHSTWKVVQMLDIICKFVKFSTSSKFT